MDYIHGIGHTEYEERLQYLYDNVPYNIEYRNGQIYITALLRTCDSADCNVDSRTIEFSTDALFKLTRRIEKDFYDFKYPVNIKYNLAPGNDYVKGSSNNLADISAIALKQYANFDSVANFFKNTVTNTNYFGPDTDLYIWNKIGTTDFSKLYSLGDVLKFKNIYIVLDEYFEKECDSLTLKDDTYPKLETLDGIEILLNDKGGNIFIHNKYLENEKLKSNIESDSKLSKIVKLVE